MPSTPTLLAQLSDPHLQVGPGDGESARALAAGVRAVAALDPAPEAVLVSGDLAEHATAREYERVRELLAPLPMPVHVLAGNHDDRDGLREHFGEPSVGEDPSDAATAGEHRSGRTVPGEHASGAATAGRDRFAAGEPFQYATRCGPLRLVACDTTVPGRIDGRFEPDQIEWLDAALAADPATPTIVAMHHPPLLTGIGFADRSGMPEPDRRPLGDVMARHPQVRRIVAGHVHRTVAGTVGGCGVLVCPSVYLQAALDLTVPGRLELVPEPPGFAVHALVDGEVASHVSPVGRTPRA